MTNHSFDRDEGHEMKWQQHANKQRCTTESRLTCCITKCITIDKIKSNILKSKFKLIDLTITGFLCQT